MSAYKEKEWLTPAEAANLIGVKKNTVYFHIKRGVFLKNVVNGTFCVLKKEAEYYRDARKVGKQMMYLGKPVHNNSDGRYSAEDVARILDLKVSAVYYFISTKRLRAKKIGKEWVIEQKHLDLLQARVTRNAKKKKTVSAKLRQRNVRAPCVLPSVPSHVCQHPTTSNACLPKVTRSALCWITSLFRRLKKWL